MNKTIISTIILLAISLMTFNSCVNSNENAVNSLSTTQITEVDQYVEGIMERNGIPGAAVAIIKDGKTVHENYYGYANIEHQVMVEPKTVFPLLSTTKIPVITAIFKLIEEDIISLDAAIGTYLNDLPEAWKTVELKYLLAHASGLPDVRNYDKDDEKSMKEKVYKDAIVFDKGTLWRYNQTNFWLLARIIEKVTGTKFETYLLTTQFETDNPAILFSTNMLEIVPNRANRYTPLNDRGAFELDKQINGSHLNSCNGLNISLPEMVKWSKKFAQGVFINQTSKETMWQKFDFSNGGPDFTYGWERHTANDHLSYGFSGGYTTAFRMFPEQNLTIIWLTNGFEKSYSTDPVISYIAGIADVQLQDKNALALEKLSQLFFKKSTDDAIVGYKKLRDENPALDMTKALFDVASGKLNDDRAEESLTIYELFVLDYPENWMGYYGRANANRELKNHSQAILDYRKSAQLNQSASDKAQLFRMADDLKASIKAN